MKLVNESVSDFLKGKPQHEINATLTQMLPKLLSDLEIEDIEDFEFDIDVPVRTTWLVYQMAPHKRQEILDGIARSAKNYFDGGEVEVEIDRSDIFITIKDALLEGGRGKLEFTLNGMGGPISGDFDGDGGYSQDHDFEDEDYTWKECWDQAQEWQNSNPYWHPRSMKMAGTSVHRAKSTTMRMTWVTEDRYAGGVKTMTMRTKKRARTVTNPSMTVNVKKKMTTNRR